jgi:hypothetical protein
MMIVDCSTYGPGSGVPLRKRLRPYDDHGRFVPLACQNPECGYGTLYHEGHGVWECDGLMDPGDPSKELAVCTYAHRDGDPWPYRS